MLVSTTSLQRSISRAVGANSRTAIAALGAVRNLNVHEYISMEILHANRIPTPKAYVAKTAEEADDIYNQKLAGSEFLKFIYVVLEGFLGYGLAKDFIWITAQLDSRGTSGAFVRDDSFMEHDECGQQCSLCS